ncbi:MAG TPA: serine hydrolase domain-containing protein [Verrucomicrobiae bacterium]|nr:serine hydrolase domain-containing protein [Verrucomicrobiae bacterium]
MKPSTTASFRLAASALVILLLVSASAASDPNNAKVDKLFAQWDRKDSPGAAIVAVKDGTVVYQRGYGYANLEHNIPITPQTRFDVASVAKQFTGLAVAMLIEQGKLSLDDDVRKHLPDVPDFGKPITIGHLVHHTSGLRDWPESFRLSNVDFEAPISFEMILELVRRQRELDFAPGEEYLYSNTGYNLLAATVAKVSGQSFRAWTDANLFRPLGMKQTHVCDNTAEIVPDFAESYGGDGPGTYQRVISQLSAQGSSSLFISAEDMGKWLLNFETAKVGGRKAIDLMQQSSKLNNGKKVNYGFGIGLDDYHGHHMFQHSGSWAGYRSFTMVIPEKRFAVAVLANTANMNPNRQAEKIADLYLGMTDTAKSDKPSAKSRAAVKADPATWDAFLGTYRLGPGWLLTITREGDTLMTQATREAKFKMTPTGTNTFLVEAYSNREVEFVRQQSGAVTNLIYNGIDAPKLDLPDLAPARLAAYAGDYWSEELGVVARMEIHDGRLAFRHRSGLWFHFLPIGPDSFDADFRGWTLQFTRNAAGEATEVKISGGRVRNIRYTRTTLPQSKL